MQKGKIGVTTENIFPVIKKFLYSDHEIFLRELVSNGVDAIQKLKALANAGEFKGNTENCRVVVSIDKNKKTLTVSDNGIGMSAEEVDKYINQIAFSSAGEFLEKYKNQAETLIGHFGLGFYSAFMVAEKVEIITRSFRENSPAVRWSCNGSPEYELTEASREDHGTDVILYIDKESEEFLEEDRIGQLLNKYCRFLPVPVVFGKEKEWKDGKLAETSRDRIINTTVPLWTRKPSELKEEDYLSFYHDLYPTAEDPLFYIHLNVDYPFNLTGILYFPRIKNALDIQKNKIQLYCRQVYVTDSVEGIVPDYLTLLHGVIDSPDIPLNVSRSYLQSDASVKKISSHIVKKVADRLYDIFKNQREEFEKKWDDLKLFITYGMMQDEKFYERAEKFALFKNTEGKYFTFEEYEKLIQDNQTDKNKKLIYLYATNKEEQYTFIEAARNKGYDVLLMDGYLDTHFINHLESKFKDAHFTRVDADVIHKLIVKEETKESLLTPIQKEMLSAVLKANTPAEASFYVQFEELPENELPVLITQPEWTRRMKDMSSLAGTKSFYSGLPDTYNLVVNTNHRLIKQIIKQLEKDLAPEIEPLRHQLEETEAQLKAAEELQKGKKENEISSPEKEKTESLRKQKQDLKQQQEEKLNQYGKNNILAKQLVDLALLANNKLTGESLSNFVKRSVMFINPSEN